MSAKLPVHSVSNGTENRVIHTVILGGLKGSRKQGRHNLKLKVDGEGKLLTRSRGVLSHLSTFSRYLKREKESESERERMRKRERGKGGRTTDKERKRAELLDTVAGMRCYTCQWFLRKFDCLQSYSAVNVCRENNQSKALYCSVELAKWAGGGKQPNPS